MRVRMSRRAAWLNLKSLVTPMMKSAAGLGLALALLPQVPAGCLVVSESGLKDRATIVRLESHGVGAFLIGESLMREADIGSKLDELRGAVGREGVQ